MFVRFNEFRKLQVDFMVYKSRFDALELCFQNFLKSVNEIIDQNKAIIDQNQSVIDTNKIVLDKIEEYLKETISSE